MGEDGGEVFSVEREERERSSRDSSLVVSFLSLSLSLSLFLFLAMELSLLASEYKLRSNEAFAFKDASAP